METREKVILPPKYYLDYFEYLIRFVEEKSAHLLAEEDQYFISNFRSLSEDARCVLIRMANRKGELFRLDKFHYDEINNHGSAVEELIESDFVTIDLIQDPTVFYLFTKSELIRLYPDRFDKRQYKDDILLQLTESSDLEDFQAIQGSYTIAQILVQEQIEFLKMLFFGHTHGMMTEFVIRDVGNIKLENLEAHEFRSWFDTRAEAVAVFELSNWSRAIRLVMELEDPEELSALISPVNWSNYLQYPGARKPGDRLMIRLGEYFERNGQFETALVYYELARKHPSRERRIRIYEKQGKTNEAQELAEAVIEQPYNASESIFARDYLAKQGVRTNRSMTRRINESPIIKISPDLPGRVEQQSLTYFEEQGYQGVHSENYSWRSLFGLVFWTELFDAEMATFHHPLQRNPSDLYNEDFYSRRREDLQSRLATFKTKKQLIDFLEDMMRQKAGINNPLVSWHESMVLVLPEMIRRLPLKGVKNVLIEISKNVKDNSTGFPDLFIWNTADYHFYEIKSPNDHLSAQQLFWLDFLSENKIRAEILRVKYS